MALNILSFYMPPQITILDKKLVDIGSFHFKSSKKMKIDHQKFSIPSILAPLTGTYSERKALKFKPLTPSGSKDIPIFVSIQICY